MSYPHVLTPRAILLEKTFTNELNEALEQLHHLNLPLKIKREKVIAIKNLALLLKGLK